MRLKTAAVGLAAGVLLLAGGCAKKPSVDVETSAGALASAVEHTQQAGTGRFETTITTSGTPTSGTATEGLSGLADLDLTFEGTYDIPAHRVAVTTDLSSLMSSLAPDGSEGSGLLDGIGGQVQVVKDGNVIYAKLPMLGRMMGSSADQWIKFDATALGVDPAQPDAAAGGGLGMQDPSTYLDLLQGVAPDLSDAGHEAVRGVDTTHLHGTVVPRTAIDSSVSDEARAKLQELYGQLGSGASALDTPLPIDVYVDDQGLVRRMSIDVSHDGVDVTVSTDFFDFGTAVDIVVPTGDQVFDASGAFGGLLSKSGFLGKPGGLGAH